MGELIKILQVGCLNRRYVHEWKGTSASTVDVINLEPLRCPCTISTGSLEVTRRRHGGQVVPFNPLAGEASFRRESSTQTSQHHHELALTFVYNPLLLPLLLFLRLILMLIRGIIASTSFPSLWFLCQLSHNLQPACQVLPDVEHCSMGREDDPMTSQEGRSFFQAPFPGSKTEPHGV